MPDDSDTASHPDRAAALAASLARQGKATLPNAGGADNTEQPVTLLRDIYKLLVFSRPTEGASQPTRSW